MIALELTLGGSKNEEVGLVMDCRRRLWQCAVVSGSWGTEHGQEAIQQKWVQKYRNFETFCAQPEERYQGQQ
jgi:hypothetical protein